MQHPERIKRFSIETYGKSRFGLRMWFRNELSSLVEVSLYLRPGFSWLKMTLETRWGTSSFEKVAENFLKTWSNSCLPFGESSRPTDGAAFHEAVSKTVFSLLLKTALNASVMTHDFWALVTSDGQTMIVSCSLQQGRGTPTMINDPFRPFSFTFLFFFLFWNWW